MKLNLLDLYALQEHIQNELSTLFALTKGVPDNLEELKKELTRMVEARAAVATEIRGILETQEIPLTEELARYVTREETPIIKDPVEPIGKG